MRVSARRLFGKRRANLGGHDSSPPTRSDGSLVGIETELRPPAARERPTTCLSCTCYSGRAHPYKRDLKDLEFHILDTGHFALEEDGHVIAELMRSFLDRKVAR